MSLEKRLGSAAQVARFVSLAGRVKLAVHIETNKKVAIKIIKKAVSDNESKNAASQKKLEREIAIMKLIKQYPII